MKVSIKVIDLHSFFFQENKEDVTVKSDVNGFKRAGPLATLLSNEKVQEAAVDKGIDIAGKLVDKQMQIVDDAQKKASDFLANEVRSPEQDFNSTVYNKKKKTNALRDSGYVILIIIKIVFINTRDEPIEKWWEGGGGIQF